MKTPSLLLILDGFDPSYVEIASPPHLDALRHHSSFALVEAVLPTVTNVNHAAIITGQFPERTGIASNFRFDPNTGRGEFIESSEALRCPTVLESIAARGGKTALLTSKRKLLRFLGRGAHFAVAAEEPPREFVQRLGTPPPIYSDRIDDWTLRALLHLVRTEHPDVVYCTTTDYVTHRWPPDAGEAIAYVRGIDQRIGELLELAHDYRIVITADHGMRAKTRAVDLVAALAAAGIRATFVPPIKDRYVVHHQNMGGSGYVFLHSGSVKHARTVLARLPGVLAVEERETAAQLFRLPLDAIGDLFVLADEATVFAPSGVFSDIVTPVSLRSHGSQHERTVPMWGAGVDVRSARWNLDASRLLGLVPEERT
ncbi:alkaline phosphatase family protein [Thermomicrobium sp.]